MFIIEQNGPWLPVGKLLNNQRVNLQWSISRSQAINCGELSFLVILWRPEFAEITHVSDVFHSSSIDLPHAFLVEKEPHRYL